MSPAKNQVISQCAVVGRENNCVLTNGSLVPRGYMYSGGAPSSEYHCRLGCFDPNIKPASVSSSPKGWCGF